MPLRKKVTNPVSTDIYSMQIYGETLDYNKLNPTGRFTKWAAVEVKDHSKIPEELFPYELKEGLYAVFIDNGTPDTFPKTFAHIFEDWKRDYSYAERCVLDRGCPGWPQFDID